MKKMLLHDAITAYLEDLETRREKPETTLKSYRNTLRRFEQFALERGAVYIQDVTEKKHAVPYKQSINDKADNTVRSYIMAVRSLFTFAMERRWVKQNPFSRIVTRESVQKQPTILSRDQLNTVLYHARNTTLYTIYLVGGDAGLRISEILNLELNHLDFENSILIVWKGKGKKTRLIPMTPRLAQELKTYIEKDRPNVGDSNHVFLMPSGRVVQANFVNDDLKQIAKAQLGLHLTSHMLRHSFATTLYNQSHDILAVADLLGHTSTKTTERYLHVSQERSRKLIEGLNE
ncbi:tyrosine-type recombinase/integrase [Exiguobacterium aurantiacum]|uniref:tyrosine-type recombinase/integrase n=1 Tax=Exiguobacterium aurantiacum TaxID=33987 RepID=UPI0008777CB9|nr:tyrosine-type recombinase/integrase [Exiguobacterium aurantiacum]